MLASFFNKTKQYIADIKEGNRLIERERMMAESDVSRIVLVSEFLKSFDQPLKVGGSARSHIQRAHDGNSDRMSRLVAYIHEYAPYMVFRVREDELTEKSKEILGESLAIPPEVRDRIYLEAKAQFKEMTGIDLDDPSSGIEVVVRQNIIKIFPAMHLGPLLDLWDRVNSLDKTKNISLVAGQSEQMLAFWKAVNALESYNHLFPDSRIIRRPPKEEDKERVTWEDFIPKGA